MSSLTGLSIERYNFSMQSSMQYKLRSREKVVFSGEPDILRTPANQHLSSEVEPVERCGTLTPPHFGRGTATTR